MTKARKNLAKLQGAEYPRARRQRQSTADGLPVLGSELRLAATECVYCRAGLSGAGQDADRGMDKAPTRRGGRAMQAAHDRPAMSRAPVDKSAARRPDGEKLSRGRKWR